MLRPLAKPYKLFEAGVEDAKLGLTPRIYWLKKSYDPEDHHHYLDGYKSVKSGGA